MRIKSIKLENFLSFENVHLDFINDINETPKLYLIDGLNYDGDNEDASNGSGKSALIGESLTFNIYGKGLRGSKQKVKLNDLIRHGTDRMFNRIEYFINTEEGVKTLSIEREKILDGPNNVNILIDGESKTKRTKRLSDKDISLFININPDIFSQIIVYYRDNLNLLSMNYGQRLDFFKKVIDLSIIDDYYVKVKDFRNENEKHLYRLKQNYKSTKEIIDIVDENKDKYKSYLVNRLNELYSELEKLKSVKFEDTDKLKEKYKKYTEAIDLANEELVEIQSNISYTRKTIDKLNKEVQKINKLSGGECPTCKQYIGEAHINNINNVYKKEIDKHQQELDTLLEKYDIINGKIKKIKEKADVIKNNINKIENDIYMHNQKINNIKKEIKKVKRDIEELENDDTQNVDKNKYEKRLEHIEKAIKLRENWAESANYWYDLLAPKSLLRSTIICKYINILSDIFEYYMSKLYNNEILSKIEIDDSGQIDFILYKDNFEINYWQMSSGERKRIDIAMILSLYEFTSHLNPNIPKFMILDEIYDSLDYPGIEAVTQTLIDVQKRHNIDLYIISHIPLPLEDIDESVDLRRILVTKKDKVSSAQFVD